MHAKIKMAARSITANISNKLNVIAKNLEKAPKPHKITFDKRKRPGFYSEGIASRLPPAYFKWRKQPGVDPPPIYWEPPKSDWMRHPETGERLRTERTPLRVTYPKQSQLELWSGEGYMQGFKKSKETRGVRFKKCWKPFVHKRELYSEILDRTFTIPVTMRTLDLVDKAYGFDFYILKTPPEILNSLLGMTLKRHMLLRLAEKDKMYPNDADKREKVHNKYSKFVIPKKEAEWVGLTRSQAIAKQRILENEEKPVRPLQDVLTEELVAQLKEEQRQSGAFEFPDLDKKSRPLLSRIFGQSPKEKDEEGR